MILQRATSRGRFSALALLVVLALMLAACGTPPAPPAAPKMLRQPVMPQQQRQLG